MSSQKITDTFKQVKSRRVQSNKQLKQADVYRNGDVKNKALDIKESEDEKRFLEDLEILRDFDLQAKYGPCIGLTRLERLKRAENFGLSPPEKVRELVEKNINDERYTQCVWNDYNI